MKESIEKVNLLNSKTNSNSSKPISLRGKNLNLEKIENLDVKQETEKIKENLNNKILNNYNELLSSKNNSIKSKKSENSKSSSKKLDLQSQGEIKLISKKPEDKRFSYLKSKTEFNPSRFDGSEYEEDFQPRENDDPEVDANELKMHDLNEQRRNTKGKEMMKNFKKIKKQKPKPKVSLINLAEKEKDHLSKEVRGIFKSDSLLSNNIKSLQKERKINDTIVAIISFIMIILCFYQLSLLIDGGYYLTDKILTLRTCIVILSIPNCKLILFYKFYIINFIFKIFINLILLILYF